MGFSHIFQSQLWQESYFREHEAGAYIEVLKRLKGETRRGREIWKHLVMDGETEQTWWGTAMNEQIPQEAGREYSCDGDADQ
ncbi:hypothetical protein CRG98_043628 [Punica granatum]|uniref:Uncharacterized protein n=1 Tax=Punica granatum TaxID=22663 RepID=A0A2I0HWB9_PUNGR|nr:hypothetical protein CRG98_043628 [Punica granatum]